MTSMQSGGIEPPATFAIMGMLLNSRSYPISRKGLHHWPTGITSVYLISGTSMQRVVKLHRWA